MRWVVFAIVLSAGCGKKDPVPTCAEVTDHMLEVTKQQLVGHDNMVLGQRSAMIAQCEQRDMPADKRRCLVAAKDIPGLGACQAGKADATPADPVEKPRAPRPPAPVAPK